MAKKKTSPSSSAPDSSAKTPARRRATTPRPRATAQATAPRSTDPTHEEIAEAAYHRYLSRGGDHGRDFDDWVEAERDLRTRGR